MSDTIEQEVRAILADEVRGLPFGVSADLVRARLVQRRRRRALQRIGLVAAAIVVAAGTFAIYNSEQKPVVATTPSPSAGPSSTGTPSPSASAPSIARSIAPSQLPTSSGTMILDIATPVAAKVDVPVVCSWSDTSSVASFRIVSKPVTLFGEQVTAAFVDDATSGYQELVLQRPGQARYYDPYDVMRLLFPALSTELNLRLDTSQGAAVPFKGTAASDELVGNVSVDCGWPPIGVPAAPLATNAPMSRGSATFVLDAPASATVTTPIDCQWDWKTHVVFYSFPQYIELFGEEVSLQLGDGGQPDNPQLTIDRLNLALYDGTGATSQADGYGTADGAIHFRNLTPNPESYPMNEPLPSPLEPFIKPIGGNSAAANLAGTLSWSCGPAPAGLPDVAPTPEPTTPEPSGTPLVTPSLALTVKGQQGSWPGTELCGMEWDLPTGGPVSGIYNDCWGPEWLVPSEVVQVKAGSTLVVTVAGFKLAAADITGAPTARVKYYRGGQPDQTITIHPIASKLASLSYTAPAAGDWILQLLVRGTAADGSAISATVFFHVVVTP